MKLIESKGEIFNTLEAAVSTNCDGIGWGDDRIVDISSNKGRLHIQPIDQTWAFHSL